MILAITQRYELSEGGSEKYSIDKDFKDIFEKLNILLFPISSLTHISKVLDICDGLVVTGSCIDVNPLHYNETPIAEVHDKADEIDNLDFTLIREFDKLNKPILGICRGIQSINVCFGGKLYQDINNHKLPKTDRHSVKIEKESFLYDCYNVEKMQVNSLHHQAVKNVAPNFKVAAISDDGIVEGIEKDNIMAVQWHPEMMQDMKLFKYFVKIINGVIR